MKSTGRLPRTIPCPSAAPLPMRRSSSWTVTGSLQSPARSARSASSPLPLAAGYFGDAEKTAAAFCTFCDHGRTPAALPHPAIWPATPRRAPRLRRPVRRSDQAHGLPDRAGGDRSSGQTACRRSPAAPVCTTRRKTASSSSAPCKTARQRPGLRKALREKLSPI